MRISAGKYKGRPIATTSGPGYRPATSKTRQAVFNMLVARGWIAEQGRVADLFAGSGSLGFEALSRGAGHVLFVEQDRRAADFIRRAAESLHLAPGIARVVTANVLTVLPKGPPGGPFDLIFADPPYDMEGIEQLHDIIFEKNLLTDEGWFILEHSKDREFSDKPFFIERRSYGSVNFSIFVKE